MLWPASTHLFDAVAGGRQHQGVDEGAAADACEERVRARVDHRARELEELVLCEYQSRVVCASQCGQAYRGAVHRDGGDTYQAVPLGISQPNMCRLILPGCRGDPTHQRRALLAVASVVLPDMKRMTSHATKRILPL